MLKAKKGFSLIELLVVIAIIGVLSAVGITAYSGYTADAKKKVTMAQHKQVVSFLNAESAKCAGGEGTFAFMLDQAASASADLACTAAWSKTIVMNHLNSPNGMAMANAYAPGEKFAIQSGTHLQGRTMVTHTGTGITRTITVLTKLNSDTDDDVTNTISRY